MSKRVRNPNELDLSKLAIDLDSDHEYKLTKTTTETYKLTKSASKSKGKEVQAVGNSHRYSSSPQPSSSKTPSRELPSRPRNTNELFARLISQFDDRAAESPSAAGYTAWRALVADVEYLRYNYIYLESPLRHQQAKQLVADLEGVLHEAEFGSDVLHDTMSLRKGASKGASKEEVRGIRKGFLKSWGKTLLMWRRCLQDIDAERAEKREREKREAQEKVKEQERLKAREKLKEQVKQKHEEREKLKAQEKQGQEEKDQGKKVRFLDSFF